MAGCRAQGEAPGLAGFLEATGVERDHCTFILECLYANHQNRLRSGRRSLVHAAQQQDRFLTEAQIRKALVQAEKFGYVHLSHGRADHHHRRGIDALKQLRGPR